MAGMDGMVWVTFFKTRHIPLRLLQPLQAWFLCGVSEKLKMCCLLLNVAYTVDFDLSVENKCWPNACVKH